MTGQRGRVVGSMLHSGHDACMVHDRVLHVFGPYSSGLAIEDDLII